MASMTGIEMQAEKPRYLNHIRSSWLAVDDWWRAADGAASWYHCLSDWRRHSPQLAWSVACRFLLLNFFCVHHVRLFFNTGWASHFVPVQNTQLLLLRLAPYCVSLSVFVCHKSVLCRNGWTDRAGFWHGGFLQFILHCALRKFVYLDK